MNIFKKRKHNEKLSENMLKYIELNENFEREENKKPEREREILPPSTDAQLVVNCLCDLFLGEDWYVVDPISTGQINTLILDEILYKHSKAYRDYIDNIKKQKYDVNCR